MIFPGFPWFPHGFPMISRWENRSIIGPPEARWKLASAAAQCKRLLGESLNIWDFSIGFSMDFSWIIYGFNMGSMGSKKKWIEHGLNNNYVNNGIGLRENLQETHGFYHQL